MNLTFAESVDFDVYRPFYLSDYYSNNMMVFAAGYEGADKVEDNFGFTMVFWIGADLNETTNIN